MTCWQKWIDKGSTWNILNHDLFLFFPWIPYIYVCIILFTKIIEIFWYRYVTEICILAYFETKNQTRKGLNYIKSSCAKLFQIFFNIFYGTKYLKTSEKKIRHVYFFVVKWQDVHKYFELYQVLCIIFCGKFFSILLYYWLKALKALFSENWFYFFCLTFWHAKIPSPFRVAHYWH